MTTPTIIPVIKLDPFLLEDSFSFTVFELLLHGPMEYSPLHSHQEAKK